MSNPTIQRLLKKAGCENLLTDLNKLTLSELNSLLLEVFRQRASRQLPKDILNAYEQNRFVTPSSIDPVSFLEGELALLRLAAENGFTPMELSPLAPLGSTSAIALADQNKIVSALRGVEVVADATNVLALEAATKRMHSQFDDTDIHLSTVHRHVRAQSIAGKGFTAHFKIFCMVSAGRDKGNFSFESDALKKHIQFYHDYFSKTIREGNVRIVIKDLKEDGIENLCTQKAYEELKTLFPSSNDLSIIKVPADEHRYYRHLRFSVNLIYNGIEYNIGDGGFVDWPDKLTGNKKERMLTSGVGLEFLMKLLHNKL